MTLYAKDILDREDLTRVARHAIVDESGTEIVSDVVDEAWRERIIAAVNSSQPELRKALEFYASPFNWTSGRWVRGSEEDDEADEPVANLICIDHQIEEGGAIPFADCGDRARKALSELRRSEPKSGEKL